MASSCIFLILLLKNNLMKLPGMGMRLKIEFRSRVKYFNVHALYTNSNMCLV